MIEVLPENGLKAIVFMPFFSHFARFGFNHPEQLMTNKFIEQKLDYLHMSPLIIGIVQQEIMRGRKDW